jgi:hypothetical protein
LTAIYILQKFSIQKRRTTWIKKYDWKNCKKNAQYFYNDFLGDLESATWQSFRRLQKDLLSNKKVAKAEVDAVLKTILNFLEIKKNFPKKPVYISSNPQKIKENIIKNIHDQLGMN